MEIEIIRQLKAKKDEGLDLFIENYSGLINYIVRNILSNVEEVEECTNDIYIKIWKSIDSYDKDRGKFTSWITVVSRNTALDYLKKSQKLDEEIKEEFPSKDLTENIVLKKERIEELRLGINMLTAEERQIFYRKYYYLQKTSQIAAELGLTERSVEGRLYRTRKKLQTILGGVLDE